MMTVKDRYTGIQSAMRMGGDSACLFLCLLSIAEESTNKQIDFIDAYKKSLRKGYIDKDFYCRDQEAMLKMLTGKTWRKVSLEKLPKPVPDKMYTVEKWHNPKTGFTHFKRRGFDTLDTSITVQNGKILGYYTYEWEED